MSFFEKVFKICELYGPMLLRGVGNTILISIIGTVLGLLIGLLVGIVRTAPKAKNKFFRMLQKINNGFLATYIEVFRGTPMMVQSMVIFYGFASLTGVRLNLLFAGIFVVSINTGAYIAEIVRGGIISIDKGQFEGAQAVGLTHWQTMRLIVIPQVLRNILPAVSNEFVINIKDTSVLNVIGVSELYFQARGVVGATYATFETYLIICVLYLVLTFTITRILRLVEKKLAGKKNYKMTKEEVHQGDNYGVV